jgi:hypothetical protein
LSSHAAIRPALEAWRAESGGYPVEEALAALDALLAENQQQATEIERLRDRAVCSGCGQDVDEGGACHTSDCDDGEMIPASDLPGALLECCEKFAEERAEWRFDWEELRAEAKGLAAELERLRRGDA